MFFKQKRSHDLHLWPRVEGADWGDTRATLAAMLARWEAYDAATIDPEITSHDDMLGADANAQEAYQLAGRSALRLLSEAMLLTGRTAFPAILDLPCGGGRVTRHLKAFFPDSEIHVGDIDADKLAAVTAQFGVTPFPFPHDFRGEPGRRFDLIFVGSLLTHFDRDLFEASLDFFIKALAPGGIAAISLHGRTNASWILHDPLYDGMKADQADYRATLGKKKKWKAANFDPDLAIGTHLRQEGFGYFTTPPHTVLYGQDYGGAFSAPSFVMKLVEARADSLIIGYKERSYGYLQDVLLVKKLN